MATMATTGIQIVSPDHYTVRLLLRTAFWGSTPGMRKETMDSYYKYMSLFMPRRPLFEGLQKLAIRASLRVRRIRLYLIYIAVSLTLLMRRRRKQVTAVRDL